MNPLKKNLDWVVTLPILFTLLVVFSVLGKNIPLSDGIRYWETAGDFLNGFSQKKILESYLLTNGPIYPLILSLFRGMGFGVKACILLNAVFLYTASVYFFKLLRNYLNFKKSLLFTYLLLLVDPFLFYWGAKLYSEPLSILFVCLFLYTAHLFFLKKLKKHLYLAALFLGLLALTRVIFGYVIPVLFSLYLILFILNKQKKIYLEFAKLHLVAFFITIPYLIFTYNITQKVFFWSDNGGMLLYWTASPHKTDLGEWHVFNFDYLKDHLANRYNQFSGLDSIHLRNVNDLILDKMKSDHTPFIDTLEGLNRLEFDSRLKEMALANIQNHPANFFRNWLLNTGRLMIGYPHALYFKPPYSPVFSLLNILKSSLLLFLFLASILLYLLKKSYWNHWLTYVILFLGVFLGGQSLLAVQSQRFLLPIYAPMIFIISVIFEKYVKISK